MNHVLTPAQTESAPASQLMISQATELGLQILIFNASLQPSLSKSGGTLTDFTKKQKARQFWKKKKHVLSLCDVPNPSKSQQHIKDTSDT